MTSSSALSRSCLVPLLTTTSSPSASDILSHPDEDENPTSSRYAEYGVKVLGIPLGSQEFMEKFVKEKFEGLRDEWSNVLCYHDPQ
jgi:hypothetical protein